MKAQTISNLFHAITRLERAVESASGNDALNDEEAQKLLDHINGIAAVTEASVLLLADQERDAAAQAATITHAQATWVDSTLGHHGGH
jgi:hypothetical protein